MKTSAEMFVKQCGNSAEKKAQKRGILRVGFVTQRSVFILKSNFVKMIFAMHFTSN